MADLVESPEDRFSHVAAPICYRVVDICTKTTKTISVTMKTDYRLSVLAIKYILCVFCVTFYRYLGLFQNEQKWLTLQTTSTSLTIIVQNEQNRLKLQPFLSKRQFRLRSPITFVQFGQKWLVNKIGAYMCSIKWSKS